MHREFLKKNWKYLLILLLIFFPIFQHLGVLAIRMWDESRLAINAYEMYQHGNFLIPMYDGSPDMWNTKPPLMIWFQVLSMKLFGVSEFSVRFPSAMAAFFTCILLLFFSVRYLKNFWLGFFCALALVTTTGFIDLHAARTGDYDVLLTLFLTFSCLAFFAFMETSKNKYLYLFFLSLTLAFLTKSSAALMILPGLFIYVIIQKKLSFLLKNKHLYIGILSFLILGGGYYFLREIYNSGYIDAAWKNDFGGRFSDTIEEHKRSFWYYIIHRFNLWLLLLPCGVFVGLKNRDKRIKNLTLFSTIVTVSFLLIISSAQTKLPWYNMPLYPFISILAAIYIYHLLSLVKGNRRNLRFLRHKLTSYAFIFLVFIVPYTLIFNKTYQPKEKWEDSYRMSYYLRDILREKREGDNFIILYDGYSAHIRFYVNLLNENGKNISFGNSNEVKSGEIILTPQDKMKKHVEEKYEYKVIEDFYNLRLYEIVQKNKI